MSALRTRREALAALAGGFGLVGLGGMLPAATSNAPVSPWSVKPPHFAPKAKHVIFLFLNGGLSHIDSFDYKPMLDKFDGKPLPYETPRTEFATGNLMKSPFSFKQYGKNGTWVSELFPNMAGMIDEFCDYSVHAFRYPESRAVDDDDEYRVQPRWASLDGFVDHLRAWYGKPESARLHRALARRVGGRRQHQVEFRVSAGGVSGDLRFRPADRSAETDSVSGEFAAERLATAAATGSSQRSEPITWTASTKRPELEATIQSMEIAFRMQTEVPDVFDIRKESQATSDRYGDGDFARGCLTARRLVEHGVRTVQVYYGNANDWDQHADIMGHKVHAGKSDAPIAALDPGSERPRSARKKRW